MTHGSLFSGIGGFDLAAEWMGWENKFHCEWNEFGRKILSYYWPDAASYKDIKNADFTIWNGQIDILTGGFPCQPFSSAGNRKGTEDDRYLWPQMLRAIREIKPRYVVGENVDGIFTWNDGLVFETVCADLENEGYEIQTFRIPACAKEAPHRRDRWWFVGHSKHAGQYAAEVRKSGKKGGGNNEKGKNKFCKPSGSIVSRETTSDSSGGNDGRYSREQKERQKLESGKCVEQSNVADSDSVRQPGPGQYRRPGYSKENGERKINRIVNGDKFKEPWMEAATRLCRMDDGLSRRLDGITFPRWRTESIKGFGNAVTPLIPYEIFKAIEEVEKLITN